MVVEQAKPRFFYFFKQSLSIDFRIKGTDGVQATDEQLATAIAKIEAIDILSSIRRHSMFSPPCSLPPITDKNMVYTFWIEFLHRSSG